jgi:UDP:flavonoid glycosyltransferase YjiC (YdhE family)
MGARQVRPGRALQDNMANILVPISPFQGHVGPLLTVASALVRAGHHALVWTGAAFEEQVRAAGAQFAALPRDVDFDGRNMSRHFPEFPALPPGPEMHRFFWKRVFIDAIDSQQRGLRQLLLEFPASIVLHDQVFLGAFPLVLRTALPGRPTVVSLGVLPPTLLSEDAVPFALGVTPADAHDPGGIGELNQLALRTYADVQQHAESVFFALGLALNDFIFNAMVRVPDHYLQLSVPSFEYPRRDLPRSFRFIGALPPSLAPGFHEPEWWPELSSGKPVVVVTQGTLANEDLTELIVPTMRALAGLELLLIVATARADGPDEVRRLVGAVPANARVEGYVPFSRLLPHASVLVTNGGYGGVHVALHNAVPLVVAGDTEDKADVCARVQWSGVGLDMRTGRPTDAAIREAVLTVLAEGRFAAAAKRMCEEFARHRPLDAIVDLVGALSGDARASEVARP